jgi:hypothetical protein
MDLSLLSSFPRLLLFYSVLLLLVFPFLTLFDRCRRSGRGKRAE